ncbi:10389_t:CDS:2, partial [Funneliformis caledonium]
VLRLGFGIIFVVSSRIKDMIRYEDVEKVQRLQWWSINDITNDVSTVTDAIIARTGDKPVLVGHSLGGGIVQNNLKHNQQKVAGEQAPSNTLVKYFQICQFLLSLKRSLPLKQYVLVGTPELMKRFSFSKAFPDSMAIDIHPKLDK